LTAIREGVVRSAHDVSEGGLAVALAECCISAPDGHRLGAEVQMEGSIRPDAWLFGESQSRIVLSLRKRHLRRLQDLADAAEVPLSVLGEVRPGRLHIGNLVDIPVDDLHRVWSEAIPRRMAG
jgi:phosphoribosylformylglycinamidine synthase